MEFTVITVCRNAAATLGTCLDSVARQRGVAFEHLVMDGASTDTSAELVRSCGQPHLQWHSEPDRGMYDALNKGLLRARGEIVGLLNADDLYADADVLRVVAENFREDPTLEAVYGDIVHFRERNGRMRVTRDWRAGGHARWKWRWGWHPPHPALFVRRRVYQELGGFRTDLPVAADMELMLRLFYMRSCRWRYLPRLLVLQRAGGMSNRSLGAIVTANRQYREAWRRQGLTPPVALIPGKLALKLAQVRLWWRLPGT